MEQKEVLIGPFKQLLTMCNLPDKGALSDKQLEIVEYAGIWISGDKIKQIAGFDELRLVIPEDVQVYELQKEYVCMPSYIDCHTHIVFGGNRANDFAMRNAGSSYLEIAESGGGIWNTVKHTRERELDQLVDITVLRANELIKQGVTTVEVKSGYGLTVEEELKILRAIAWANKQSKADLIATCLAAHTLPKDYSGTAEDYLSDIAERLFPLLKAECLTNRIDAFIEKSAFTADQIQDYFKTAQNMGFDITVHADQFSPSGSQVAVDFNAVSADHLEASTDHEIALLAKSDVVAVALPAASLGIGCTFTPARKLLDAGACLAIATDWNPGSAPMGQLIASASILAAMEKLTNAEVLAAVTFRAAKALNLTDRGRLAKGLLADFVIYESDNYQHITYRQGSLQPSSVWKNGEEVFSKN
ncbi:imidazolonepropionase [Sphingobacterium olei]|uniref:Imidazolonepropionase n=1 Tax=Sphingobacterium olei TaxID=2571155 RepID=A0A4U0NA93_9SPHI|nr:imidazolonepropionase [Sphingobacterium olei]TJZ50827.1 imidazolonepropionase [Sphingobacterium olei]